LRTRAIPERFSSGDSLRRGAISSVWTFTFTTWSIRRKETVSVFLYVYLIAVLTAIFQGVPGLASFIGAKDNGSGGDNWSCKTRSQIVTTNIPTPNFFYRPDALPCRPINSVEALKGKVF